MEVCFSDLLKKNLLLEVWLMTLTQWIHQQVHRKAIFLLVAPTNDWVWCGYFDNHFRPVWDSSKRQSLPGDTPFLTKTLRITLVWSPSHTILCSLSPFMGARPALGSDSVLVCSCSLLHLFSSPFSSKNLLHIKIQSPCLLLRCP